MTSSHPAFYRNMAYVLQLPGYMGLATCVAAIAFEEYLALIPFLGIAAGTLIPCWIYLNKTKEQKPASIASPAMFAALSYGVISVVGAIPIYGTAVVFNAYGMATSELMYLHDPLNALFESFAGMTSSGLTMVNNPGRIPHVIQLWRSLSQWLGGLGVIILAIFIFTPGVEGMKHMIQTEVGDIDVADNVHKTARTIGLIYIGFTVAAFLLYLLVNQPVWVSLNHALTSVSTGGFNVTNESFKFQPLSSKIVSLVLLVFGAMGFAFHRELILQRDPKALLRNRENLWFLVILLAGGGIVALESRLSTQAPALIDNVYQWISALTTSGYQTADIENWKDGKLFLLSVAMLIGGVAGSTAGGLKVKRLLLLVSAIGCSLAHKDNLKYKKSLRDFGEGDEIDDILLNLTVLVGLWLLLLTASVVLVSYIVSDRYGLAAVIFEVISAQSNVGLSTGLTSADMHWMIKLDFIVLMWMGRLELIAVVLLFASWLGKVKK